MDRSQNCDGSQQEPIKILEVRPNDVLFGRGFQVNNNQGNMRFRELLRQRKAEYSATKRRQKKDNIAREIVGCIYEKNGRFLQKLQPKMKSTKARNLKETLLGWKIVDTEIAVEKVKQAMRDQSERKADDTQNLAGYNNGTSQNQSFPFPYFTTEPEQLPLHLKHLDSPTPFAQLPLPALATESVPLVQARLIKDTLWNGLSHFSLPRQNASFENLSKPASSSSRQIPFSGTGGLNQIQSNEKLGPEKLIQDILRVLHPDPLLRGTQQFPVSQGMKGSAMKKLVEVVRLGSNVRKDNANELFVAQPGWLQPSSISQVSSVQSTPDLLPYIASLSQENKAAVLAALMAQRIDPSGGS